MIEIYTEDIKSDFEGTIIDIETIGEFSREPDSRRYKQIIPVVFGFITKDGIKIFCAKTENSIETLKQNIREILPQLEKPFYAFNTEFERGVLFHALGLDVKFDCELTKEKYESKSTAIKLLKISNYDDPFNDNGILCMDAWLKGFIKSSIAHNRSCLLKEKDILLKRGFREPEKLELVNV